MRHDDSDQTIVHTPGPWNYVEGAQIVMAHAGQMSVADIRGFGYLCPTGHEMDRGIAEMDENGRLIASAPALKEALEKIAREHPDTGASEIAIRAICSIR